MERSVERSMEGCGKINERQWTRKDSDKQLSPHPAEPRPAPLLHIVSSGPSHAPTQRPSLGRFAETCERQWKDSERQWKVQ